MCAILGFRPGAGPRVTEPSVETGAAHRAREPQAPAYREITVAGMLLGIVTGILLTASMTYAGLVIGFVVPASAVAAIVGWGLLRGVLRRGTIVENNINQTVASAINNTSAGVIFTFPALFLIAGVSFNPWAIGVAAVAGGVLGTLFIIPLRKQMIDFERLRFPSGIAVAQILRSPGAATRKSALLIGATGVALVFGMAANFGVLPEQVDLGTPLGLPAYIPNVWALSLLSVGAGFISGRAGLVVLGGGVLANWIIAPLVVGLDWVVVPEAVTGDKLNAVLASTIYGQINRPLGIGLLIGGAIAGVIVAAPMMKAAFIGLSAQVGDVREEMSVRWMYAGTVMAALTLTVAAYFGDPAVGLFRAVLTAVLGTLWMWIAGVIVAQCTGMTDWSPVSGMSLLAVTIVLLVSGGSVGLAVLIGAAVCVAIAQGADMMTDLKTGHLVGARPSRQQVTQILVTWIGPIIAMLTVYLIWNAVRFGPENPSIPAPQAVTLQGMIEAVQGGNVPMDKYVTGALVGGLLTLGAGGGFGVLIGLSMYLPMFYVLPYGLGCLFAMGSDRYLGKSWSLDTGLPIAAGLLVGDSLAGVLFSVYKLVATV